MHVGYSERVQLEELTADMIIFQNTWQQMWAIRSADMMWSFFFYDPSQFGAHSRVCSWFFLTGERHEGNTVCLQV